MVLESITIPLKPWGITRVIIIVNAIAGFVRILFFHMPNAKQYAEYTEKVVLLTEFRTGRRLLAHLTAHNWQKWKKKKVYSLYVPAIKLLAVRANCRFLERLPILARPFHFWKGGVQHVCRIQQPYYIFLLGDFITRL